MALVWFGGPGLLIGATNEKPRLRQQPGFSSAYLRGIILSNLAFPNPPAAMILKSKAAYGDDVDPISSRHLFRFLRFQMRAGNEIAELRKRGDLRPYYGEQNT